jgi:hypothetical protein
MTTSMLRAYRFFFDNAGYIVGHRAECALSLARAEQYARDNDWQAEWVWDDDADLSWMSDAEQREPHEVYGCVLKDENGNVLASLWGITDPDNAYMRVIEAELADESLHNEQQINRVYAC